jgi:hypothetical protein
LISFSTLTTRIKSARRSEKHFMTKDLIAEEIEIMDALNFNREEERENDIYWYIIFTKL